MFDLVNYRRRVFDLYRYIRDNHENDSLATWMHFRADRDDLFANHPQSALNMEQKAEFVGQQLQYFDYDPRYRVSAQINLNVEPEEFNFEGGVDGVVRSHRFAQVSFELPAGKGTLSLYWIKGYGGGVFLPFRDATGKDLTYGGGRYLLDTIKGADFGASTTDMILDFNYAYNPSCAYNSRWVCPLSPLENRLDFPIPAGEKRWEGLYA